MHGFKNVVIILSQSSWAVSWFFNCLGRCKAGAFPYWSFHFRGKWNKSRSTWLGVLWIHGVVSLNSGIYVWIHLTFFENAFLVFKALKISINIREPNSVANNMAHVYFDKYWLYLYRMLTQLTKSSLKISLKVWKMLYSIILIGPSATYFSQHMSKLIFIKTFHWWNYGQ